MEYHLSTDVVKWAIRASGPFRLDWLIPMSELHSRSVLNVWVTHYNEARPHMALGPVFLIPIGGRATGDSTFPASDRQALGAKRQIDTGRVASRVFASPRTGLIEYLRSKELTSFDHEVARTGVIESCT
jgi:hypothetical protein